MRVRMRVDVSGTRNGQPWPPAGQVFDVGEAEAHELARAGVVHVVPDDAHDEVLPVVDAGTGRPVETAVAPDGQTAATDTGSSSRKAARGGRSTAASGSSSGTAASGTNASG